MESQEARLYADTTLMDSLCLIVDNDEFDEIIVDDGKMIVKFTRPVQLEDGEWVDCGYTVKGVTKISFK